MSTRRVGSLIAAVFVVGITVAAINGGTAAAATCNGGEISGAGSIVVQPGVSCSLFEITLNGSITVRQGGSLNLSDSIIRGTVTAQNPDDIDIFSSYMRGLSIVGSKMGSANQFRICNSSIDGPAGISSVAAPASVVFGGGCGGNSVCGPFSARYNSARLDINGNGVAGAGTVVYNSNLTSFGGNSFGGGLGENHNTPLTQSEGNTSNNVLTAGITCPERIFHDDDE